MTGRTLVNTALMNKGKHTYVRVRDPKWANPDAYLRLSVIEHRDERSIGPWGHLFDRRSQEAIGEPTPQQLFTMMPPFDFAAFMDEEVVLYTGPFDPADQ